jgi:hypothetical protein
MCDLYREIKRTLGNESIPYQVHPEKGGVYPWGGDDNGNSLWWLTNGPSMDWKLVLISRVRGTEELEMTMTGFLASVFSREITCVLWSNDFFTGPEKVVFEPTKELHKIVVS